MRSPSWTLGVRMWTRLSAAPSLLINTPTSFRETASLLAHSPCGTVSPQTFPSVKVSGSLEDAFSHLLPGKVGAGVCGPSSATASSVPGTDWGGGTPVRSVGETSGFPAASSPEPLQLMLAGALLCCWNPPGPGSEMLI